MRRGLGSLMAYYFCSAETWEQEWLPEGIVGARMRI